MGLSVNTNVMALNAQHNLAATSMKMSKVLERLSSGLRINRAADDAAGLAVSEKLRSQIRGLSQASRNAQDGVSLIQTAEGALNETHAILQRMRELAVQAGTATLQDADRANIQAEVTQLSSELDRIANITDFNGKKLLDGTMGGYSTGSLGASLATGTGVSAINVTTTTTTGTYSLSISTASGGSVTMTMQTGTTTQAVTVSVPAAATDKKVVNFSTLGIAVTVNANLGSSAVSAADANTFAVSQATGKADLLIGAGFNGVDASNEVLSVSMNKMDSTVLLGGAVNVSTQAGAQNALTGLDTAIGTVSATRARLGAQQNRLEHTISNLGVTVENLSASESRIRDTDVAEETSRMISAQILSQAGSSILSQANQVPQAALALLRG